MSKLFNTPYEISIRVLLALETAGSAETVDKITVADFITVYGEDFGISDTNLHGDNPFRFSEFSLRRQRVETALKDLVLDGMVEAFPTKKGFKYAISSRGRNYCGNFNNVYTDEYRRDAKGAHEIIANMSGREAVNLIHEYSILSLQRGVVDV
jgi:hypothetical protein